MNNIDLSQVTDEELANEIATRLRILDTDNIACYRDKEVVAFGKAICKALDSNIGYMDQLISEFSYQREDLEHRLSFGVLEGTLNKEEQDTITNNIADAIVLRRLVKDANALTQGMRDMFRSIEMRVKKYKKLNYQGKSAVFGEASDGISIDTTLKEQNIPYQKHIAAKFIQANKLLSDRRNDSSMVVSAEQTNIVGLLKQVSGQM